MKTPSVISILSILFFVTSATAQYTSQGNFVIGSRLGFSTAMSDVSVSGASGNFSGNGGSAYQINLQPAIGYFLATNFATGIGMEYIGTGSTSAEDFTNPENGEQKSTNSDLLFGPFFRFFLPYSTDKTFFLDTSVGFGNSVDEFNNSGTTQKINNNLTVIGIGPGFTIFADNGVALEAVVKYNYAHTKNEIDLSGVKTTSITNTNALDFTFGIQYYFGTGGGNQ